MELWSLEDADFDDDSYPSRPPWILGFGGASAGDLVPLGGAGTPVADVQQRGEDDPEPVPAAQPPTRGVQQQVDQGRKRQEDDPKERPQEGAEGGVDPFWPCDLHDEHRQPREDPAEQCEQTTHLVLPSWRIDGAVAAGVSPTVPPSGSLLLPGGANPPPTCGSSACDA